MTLEPITMTPQEAAEATRIESRRQRFVWTRLLPYAITGIGFTLFATDGIPPSVAPVLLMIVGLYMAIAPIVQGYAEFDRWIARIAERPATEYEIDTASIVSRGGDFQTQCGWHAFHGWAESRSLFLLYLKGNQLGYIVPKRAFRSQADLEQARKIFREQIQDRRSLGFPVQPPSKRRRA